MDPVTAVAIGTTLLSTAAGVVQTQYQGAVADANAKQANLNADLAVDIGMSDAKDIGEENAGRLGQQAARMGASGIAVSSPSFNQARARGRQLNVQEQNRTMEGAYREAANFKTQANAFKAESKAANVSTAFQIGGGLLGVAGAMARAPTGGTGDLAGANATGAPLDLLQRKKPSSPWFSYGTGFNTGY